MVKSFKHNGVENFYLTGSKQGIQGKHVSELRMQLIALDSAQSIEDLDIPGYRLHELRGNRKGIWSITVKSHGRVSFECTDGNASIINNEEYH
jgi:proteic killer suppression protein